MSGAHAKQPKTKILNHAGVCAVDGCDRKYYAKHHCRMHWERLHRNGTTDRKGIEPGTPPAERLNSQLERVGECTEFMGYRNSNGYGELTIDRKFVLAHRLSYELSFGPIPDGLIVRHKCDNPPCVDPDHLEVGTQSDNLRDRDERGRTARGMNNGTAKLTDEDVRKIRKIRSDGWTYAELAALFSVGGTTIARVVTGTHWRHVP